MKHLPNVLYHGISLDNISSLIEDGILKPYSKMRKFFGVELRDNHKDYHKSHYYSGWCSSRDIDVSKRFGEIILVLNKDKIQHNFKIKPRSYSYSLATGKNFRKEAEEFIIASEINNTFSELSERSDKIYGKVDELEEQLYSENDPDTIKKIEEKIENLLVEAENSSLQNLFFENCQGRTLNSSHIVGFYVAKNEPDSIITKNKNTIRKLAKIVDFLGYQPI